jgi:hypothetical protein
MINSATLAEMETHRRSANLLTALEGHFFETEPYRLFRSRIFQVLEAREARLKAGLIEQKGAALIGPAGSGKSRMAHEAIAEYRSLAQATGGREFGHEVVSVIVPGRATVKETAKEILRALGYPISSVRDDDYLVQMVVTQMKRRSFAALHLDEVQDAGRHKTSDSMESFAKMFRNIMQDREWPICLILTATLEGRAFVNHDTTLTRRLRPIEILPMTFAKEGPILRNSVKFLLEMAHLDHGGLLEENEFIRVLMHAAAYRFGLAIEIAIEAIGAATSVGSSAITIDHFAEVYYMRTNNDDDLNPFFSVSWRGIDTTKAMERFLDDRTARRVRPKNR